MSSVELDYWKLEELCRKEGPVILYSSYLGEGVVGRFFPPNIILINLEKCEAETTTKQYPCIVLLHEMTHYYIYEKLLYETPPENCEECCFEFAEVICDQVLNYGASIKSFKKTIIKLDLYKQAELLKSAIKEARKETL